MRSARTSLEPSGRRTRASLETQRKLSAEEQRWLHDQLLRVTTATRPTAVAPPGARLATSEGPGYRAVFACARTGDHPAEE